ncbi:class I SAM-dependent methyltransferase [Neolewinella lacunae]|uniref:Class I SAM-dependent methyltransferase n=1 Tax=Neolewinella lacunae TaxID=1517758 RepID=A0A923PQ59_9BACT|nr:class I SAM-dependent methyltransferase [Neolewinella lacunae]MBC6994702.1 class I SAM-dependent methyltransferase [Neolewinella lacunae]MDN3634574.1 class I SAM-dependent methyltransferase [Neolewinella lacunae]
MSTKLVYAWFRIRSALRWYWAARTRYDVHSPHLVDFMGAVFRDDRQYYAFDLIRAVRRYWSGHPGRVTLQSLGAPSMTTRRNERSVRSLVATNAISDRSGRFLFRLALWLRARTILEFGTNAGISTLYLHLADTRARLVTVEGNPAVAALAQETFARVGAGPNLCSHVGLFQEWLDTQLANAFLPTAASGQPTVLDLFFLDGDHREEPTLAYVERLLPLAGPDSVFVIADIHWSEGMEAAWRQLQGLPQVTASVDVYHFGLLFFRPGLAGPHLSLVPTRFKPWRLGFFS